jgi:hypothetical protein
MMLVAFVAALAFAPVPSSSWLPATVHKIRSAPPLRARRLAASASLEDETKIAEQPLAAESHRMPDTAEQVLSSARDAVSKTAADAEAALVKTAADAEAALAKTAADAAKTAADAEAALVKTATEVTDTVLDKARADVQTLTDVGSEAVERATEAVEKVSSAEAAARREATDRLTQIAEAAASRTAAVSALGGGILNGGALSWMPGALFAKRSLEIWTSVAAITTQMASAERSGQRERKQAVGEEICATLLTLGYGP